MNGNSPKAILVTGGAGYIGSHAVKALSQSGHIPVVYDNLTHGHWWAVRHGPFVKGDIADRSMVIATIRHYDVAAVLHLASYGDVGDSMKDPGPYFENNVRKSLTLLDALVESGVKHVVFSSSCATYGSPDRMPISENTPQSPINPYGETKLLVERALHWYAKAYSISYVSMRCFNVAGADLDGEIGEVHWPETHLIPLILSAAEGRRSVEVFGKDYSTADGTCVRDFIHVVDLAEAYVRATQYLLEGGTSVGLNIGAGKGYSVKEVIECVARVTDRDISHQISPRRDGDSAVLVADPSLALRVLGWSPRHSDLECIVRTAWNWYLKHGKDFPVRTPHGL